MKSLRMSFPLVTSAAVVLSVSLLAGCVSTPSAPSYRNGDFVSHMASVSVDRPVASQTTPATEATGTPNLRRQS